MTKTQETIRDLFLKKVIPYGEIRISSGDTIYSELVDALGSEPILLGIHKVPCGESLVYFLAKDGYHDFISEDEYESFSPELWDDIESFLIEKVREEVQKERDKIKSLLSGLRSLGISYIEEDLKTIEDMEQKYKDLLNTSISPEERRVAMDVSESLNVTKSYLSRAS